MITDIPCAVRRAAVAGYFYPAEASRLEEQIDRWAAHASPRLQASGVLVPHGSWAQCGPVMGAALSSVEIPRDCIVLGPSHAGSAIGWSLMASGAYQTPLGEVPIRHDLGEALQRRCPFVQADAQAHRGEHAVEVLLPWLQRWGPEDLRIVPIIIGPADFEEADALAQALAEAIRQAQEPVLLVISSDLSHYVGRREADAMDQPLIRAACRLDDRQFLRALATEAISSCGGIAVACGLRALKRLGAAEGRVLGRGTSANGGGDPHAVVGYAGIVFPASGAAGPRSE